MPTLKFHVCETAVGYVGIALSETGLRGTTLPRPTRAEALRDINEVGAVEPVSPAGLGDLPARIAAVAAGHESPAGIPLDLDGLTPFRRAVLEEAMRIPAGETRSYGWLAQKVGRPGAARAVGRVMATNPLPLVVPCHRVIGSDGGLHGFGGGLDMKEMLLRLEGAATAR